MNLNELWQELYAAGKSWWSNGDTGIGGGPVLDWIVVGGESGQNARAFDIDWAMDVLRQRRGTDCRVFVKQLGKRPYMLNDGHTVRAEFNDWDGGFPLSDSKGGDISEWPKVLQVREWPAKFNVSGGE